MRISHMTQLFLKCIQGGSSDTLLFSMMRSSIQRNGRCIYLRQKCQEFKISVVNKTDQVITGRGSLSPPHASPSGCARAGLPAVQVLSEFSANQLLFDG